MCADQQDEFWRYQDALFFWQGRDVNQAFTESRLKSGIRELGLDQGAYELCARSGSPDLVLDEARADASTLLNFIGTPTITINGVVPVDTDAQAISGAAELLAAIDRAIETVANRTQPTVQPTAEPTSAPVVAPTEEATAEATVEGS
jgi:protein-disulfide isomerase